MLCVESRHTGECVFYYRLCCATTMTRTPGILIAIPAYNEAGTIAAIVGRVRDSLPDYDLLVVKDGSRDATGRILETLDVTVATHMCNLGYGRAVQTAIMYAIECGYDALVTLDA